MKVEIYTQKILLLLLSGQCDIQRKKIPVDTLTSICLVLNKRERNSLITSDRDVQPSERLKNKKYRFDQVISQNQSTHSRLFQSQSCLSCSASAFGTQVVFLRQIQENPKQGGSREEVVDSKGVWSFLKKPNKTTPNKKTILLSSGLIKQKLVVLPAVINHQELSVH